VRRIVNDALEDGAFAFAAESWALWQQAYEPNRRDKREDADHDGIIDALDFCVRAADDGEARRACDARGRILQADADGDGVADADDPCPIEPGADGGCPSASAPGPTPPTGAPAPAPEPSPPPRAEWPDIDGRYLGEQEHGDDAAVVIGLEDYFKLPSVPYARRDADAFESWLRYTRRVPSDHIVRLDSGGVEYFEQAVTDAAAQAEAGGTV